MPASKGIGKGRRPAEEMVPQWKKKAHALLVGKVTKESHEIIDAMIKAATGFKVQRIIGSASKGNQEVVEVDVLPDTSIGQYLINQVAGKPTETVEHKGAVTLKMDD